MCRVTQVCVRVECSGPQSSAPRTPFRWEIALGDAGSPPARRGAQLGRTHTGEGPGHSKRGHVGVVGFFSPQSAQKSRWERHPRPMQGRGWAGTRRPHPPTPKAGTTPGGNIMRNQGSETVVTGHSTPALGVLGRGTSSRRQPVPRPFRNSGCLGAH